MAVLGSGLPLQALSHQHLLLRHPQCPGRAGVQGLGGKSGCAGEGARQRRDRGCSQTCSSQCPHLTPESSRHFRPWQLLSQASQAAGGACDKAASASPQRPLQSRDERTGHWGWERLQRQALCVGAGVQNPALYVQPPTVCSNIVESDPQAQSREQPQHRCMWAPNRPHYLLSQRAVPASRPPADSLLPSAVGTGGQLGN